RARAWRRARGSPRACRCASSALSARLFGAGAGATTPAQSRQRIRQRGGEIAGGDRLRAALLRQQVGGEAVHVDAEAGALERIETLREQRADDAGEHVAAAAAGEARVPRGVDCQRPVGRGDERQVPLERYRATRDARRLARRGEAIV